MEKIKVMFVCHGNICRSPMAEFVLKDMLKKKRLEDAFTVQSSATSTDEIGSAVHYGTKTKLGEHGISVAGKYAVQLRADDYEKYDYFLGMDGANIRNTLRILGGDKDKKVRLFLDYTAKSRDIADPWYTGNFEETYKDVVEGCEAFLKYLADSKRIY
ncbi:MAG: low molecular weight phosphotyrosine protein phosphatase [Clostridia bacterium]|nr:low molecular weight phosphotyrosine protein phosphatase [Clostridia bacterium]